MMNDGTGLGELVNEYAIESDYVNEDGTDTADPVLVLANVLRRTTAAAVLARDSERARILRLIDRSYDLVGEKVSSGTRLEAVVSLVERIQDGTR
jgi:uncharacterized tellurite resistance protein B-like protein